MNYYIQGDAAKADKIKAAFEKKGYSDKGFTFDVNDILFFTANNKHINVCPANGWLANIIKTHPDYKELELPVEQLFKVGDWLYHNTYGVHPILVKDYSETQGYKVECISSTYYIQKGVVENEYHLWSIADAKDGDVLADYADGLDNSLVFILKRFEHVNYGLAKPSDYSSYCFLKANARQDFLPGKYHHKHDIKPATKEQRDLLFNKMKEAGYQWDADKKELRKIQPHYDIANFKPFDKVLIRVGNKSKWTCDFFSYYYKGFHCIGTNDWSQCIPFEGNEHLLGTTDMCDEIFINW